MDASHGGGIRGWSPIFSERPESAVPHIRARRHARTAPDRPRRRLRGRPPVTTTPPSPLGTRLADALADRYRLERELGQGGMATVYLAEDVRHRRKVALKVLHPELSAVLGPERFLKEIELTASPQHPHILPLFERGSAAGSCST